MADIKEVMSLVTETPDEAAQNLRDAKILDIPSDAYAETKDLYKADMDALRRPAEATPKLAEVMHKSPQHAAVLSDKGDVETLSWWERYSDHFMNQVWDLPNANRRSNELAQKRMESPGEFSEDELVEWNILQEQVKKIQEDETRNGFTGDFESLPAKVIGVGGDMVRGIIEERGIVGKSMAAGALGGAAWGATAAAVAGQLGPQAATPEEIVTVPAAALAGGAVGLRMGFNTGLAAATFWDTYKQSSGSLYTELTFGTDENDQPFKVSEDDKIFLARGVGLLSATIDGVLTATVAKAIPQISRAFKPSIRNIMSSTSSAAYRESLINIGKRLSPGSVQAVRNTLGAGAMGSVTETAQEMVQIVGEELGKSVTVDPEDATQTQMSIENAITRIGQQMDAYDKLPQEIKDKTPHPYWGRLKSAAIVGGVASTSFVAPFNYLGRKELDQQIAENNARFEQEQKTGIPAVLQPQPETPAAAVTSADGGSMAIAPDGPAEVPAGIARPEPSPTADLTGTVKPPAERAVRSARVKDMFATTLATLKSMSGYNSVKDQLIFTQAEIMTKAGIAQVWMDSDMLRLQVKSPEAAEKVRAALGPGGVANMQMGASVQMDPERLLTIADAHPEVLDAVQDSPEAPAAGTAIKFLADINNNDLKRQDFLKARGEEGTDLNTLNTLDQALNNDDVMLTDTMDEASYKNAPQFTELIAETLPEERKQMMMEAERQVRQEVVDGIDQAIDLEMDKVKEELFDVAMEVEFEEQVQRFENDPEIDVVEMFMHGAADIGEWLGDARRSFEGWKRREELVAPHNVEGFSPLAMDPRLVPDEFKAYLKDKRMHKNKAFVRGGISPEESARMAGVKDVKELFRILSTKHNRKDAATAATNARRDKVREKVYKSDVGVNEAAVTKAYRNKTLNHLREMNVMRERLWGATKAGIKTIALPLPRIADLTARARQAVSTTKIRHLNVNQFAMAEKRNSKKALDAILKNMQEKAYKLKENAALATELVRETRMAIGRVNRAMRAVKRTKSKVSRATLKEAGPLYENAANEILSIFGFNDKPVDPDALKYFQQLAKKSIENGDGLLQIPEQFFTPGIDPKDMTVEQLEIVSEALQNILHQARMKNKLRSKFRKKEIHENVDAAVEVLGREAVQHPDYDAKKLTTEQGDLTTAQKIGRTFTLLESMITSMEHQMTRLDNGKTAGLWHKTIFQPVQDALAQRDKDVKILQEFFKKGIEAYGKRDYMAMGRVAVQVPEFAGIQKLNNGNLTKLDLFMMASNIGNLGNIEALENFGVDRATIFKVIEANLEKRDIDFIQKYVWGAFKQYFPRVQKLHQRVANERVEMVESQSFTMFGQEYEGGYFPIYYAKNDQGGIQELMESVKWDDDVDASELRNTYFSTAMTRQGHLITRTGSKAPVSLDANNMAMAFNQVLTDLNMREPIRDSMNILKNPIAGGHAASIIGKPNYKLLTDTLVDMANVASLNNDPLFGIQNKAFQAFTGAVGGVMSKVMLVANMSSILIQPTSMFIAWERMGGRSGAKHLSKVLMTAARSPRHLREMMMLAAEMNPSIDATLNEIGDNGAMAISNLTPQKSKIFSAKTSKRIRLFTWANETINNWGFTALAQVDLIQKSLVTLSAYSQFLAGEAQGYSKVEIFDMSPVDRETAARNYAASMSRLTMTSGSPLDRAAFQKNPATNMWVRFWNDLRNVLNNNIRIVRKGKNEIKQGDVIGLTGTIFTFVAMSMMSRLYQNYARSQDEEQPWYDIDYTNPEDVQQLAMNLTSTAIGSAVLRFPESMPIVRDVVYGANRKTKGDEKTVTIPVTSVLGDTATALSATPTAISNLLDLMGVWEASDELSDVQIRALMKTGGYLLGGWPINGAIKLNRWINEIFDPESDSEEGVLTDTYNSLIERFTKKAEVIKEREDVPVEIKMEIETVQNMLDPVIEGISAQIDESVYPVIAQIESGGDWTARNPNSSAAGLYQFLEGTWAEIMDKAPELGLTENGRVSKDTTQQEKAMRWFTERNAERLQEIGVEISADNLYAMHFLGRGNGAKVLQAKDARRLRTLVSEKVMTANDFPDTMTVKQFKAWVSKKIKRAQQDIIEAEEGN